MNMGEKILNLRKARGWSQEEFADRVGVTRQAVSRWEAGTAKPEADKIIAIADLFGVSADYLLRDRYTGDAVPSCAPAAEMRKSTLTAGQLIGLALFAVGLLILFGLEIICVIHPHTLYADTKVYQGLAAYVRVYNMQWLMWLLWAVIGAGVVLLLWEPVKKLFSKAVEKSRKC